MNKTIIAKIEDKKSNEKRTAYKIKGRWFSTFDAKHTQYQVGDIVEIDFSEIVSEGKTYYNICDMRPVSKTKILSTDMQIKRQVFLKLATDIVLKTEKINTTSVQKIVTIARMIEEECQKQEYL